MTAGLLKTRKFFENQISLHWGKLFELILLTRVILACLLYFMILKYTLLEQATFAQEFDEFAWLETDWIHGVSKATIVSEYALYNLFLFIR